MKQTKNILFLFLLLILAVTSGYAQFKPNVEMTPNEKDLFKNSLEAFNEKDFTASLQGFSQLLSLYPREPVFNFVYGASMVNKNIDIKKAIDYLNFAVGKGIPEANFYIGLGYQYLYDFDNAIAHYNKFKMSTKAKIWNKYDVDKFINQAKSGKDLIRYAYELEVISNKQTSLENFYYSYELSDFGGEIIVKTDEFKTKIDKRIDQSDLMYISTTNNVVLLSSYGNSRKNSLDIYISHKIKDAWSEPQLLSKNINTAYDEAYPFLSDDGKTLYFSSKGHNSIGGYDIFKSQYNASDNSWSVPENLDFPINTPYDDIMYAVDRYGETAFFASTRESKSGQIGVYRILLEKELLARHIVSIDEVYKQASLTVKPTAIAELTKRQEIRANSMIDTSQYRTEIVAIGDTVNKNELNLDKSYKLIDEKKSLAQEYIEYASAIYQICQLNLNDSKLINNEITNLKNNRKPDAEAKADSLYVIFLEKSNIATEMFDLANFYYDKANQLITLSNYYENELDILSGLSGHEKNIKEQIIRLSHEIKNIDISAPVDIYNKRLLSEKNVKLEKLDVFNQRLLDGLEKLSEFNKKINLKLNLAKKEKDYNVRERYVYDIKALENAKIDLITQIKGNEVQLEFLDYEVKQIDNKIKIVNNNLVEIEENLTYNPDFKLEKNNNEIDLLKTNISQNSLKELANQQDRILSDTKYYSKDLNLEAILYVSSDIIDAGLEKIFVDTKLYTDKYEDILSENALQTGELIFKNDSIKEMIKDLEVKFDKAANNSEKRNIIAEINGCKAEINKNNDKITSYLNSQTPIEINSYIQDFEQYKNSSPGVENQLEVQETQKLIEESQHLANDISDLKVLGDSENMPPILYLEGMKSEIDKLIMHKIEKLKASEILVDETPNQDILKKLDLSLNEINEVDNQKEIKDITDKFKEVERLYKQAEIKKEKRQSNVIIEEANQLFDITIKQNIGFLNKKILDNYEKISIYSEAFENLSNVKESIVEQVDSVKNLKQKAADLQFLSEETQNQLEKMQNLAEACKNLELANQHYAYAFEIINDDKKYTENYEIKLDNKIELLYSYSTSLNRHEPEKELDDQIVETIEQPTETPKPIAEESRLLKKLDSVNYDGQIKINIQQQAKQKQEIDKIADNINKIKSEINNIDNKKKLEKLNAELRYEQENQIDKLIIYSEITNEIITELNGINKLLKSNYNKKLLDSLLLMQVELRSSIVEYSNFYSVEDLNQKHLDAINLENAIINIYSSAVLEANNDVLAANIRNVGVVSETTTPVAIEPLESSDLTEIREFTNEGNYEYEYDYDQETLSKLEKLDYNIVSVESKIKTHEIKIGDIKSKMQFSNSSKEYKKLQNELKKENKKYLKQLKLWAGYSKDYLSIKNNFADDYYYKSVSANNKITAVSDSLKSESEDKITESIALFELIITSKAKMADSHIVDTYKKAERLSVEGVNILNAANYLKSKGIETDALVVTHYRSVKTPDPVDVISSETQPHLDTASIVLTNNIDDTNDPIRENENIVETDIIVVVEDNNEKDEIDVDVTDRIDESFVNSEFENLFDVNAGSFYSDANPITEIPNYEGLYYRIQIAVFNGKIANNEIKGMKPIFWETIPNSDLVRYIVGNFRRYNDAGNSLPNIQAMGYNDAFIVAYYNGQRLSLYEAREIEEQETQVGEELLIVDGNQENRNALVNNFETRNLTETSGVFFCVQIGVYANQLGADRLYGLDPIMYHNYAGNLVRHTFGRYYNINTAIDEQNKIRRLGIADAFVVAYRNGEKINLNDARNILANLENPQDEITLNIPDEQIPVIQQDEPAEVVENIVYDADETIDVNAAPIVEYYIQIGVFRDDVNVFIRDSFRRMAGNNQLVRLTNNNLILYRIGLFSNYVDARSELNNVIAAGIKDAFIVAYVNGKRIDVARARLIDELK
ncbi:MAG: hypothetical protein PHW82_07275 [Bacteroidales bacterium]|nr:hypothetical protein [Bacteroidales bacterium]